MDGDFEHFTYSLGQRAGMATEIAVTAGIGKLAGVTSAVKTGSKAVPKVGSGGKVLQFKGSAAKLAGSKIKITKPTAPKIAGNKISVKGTGGGNWKNPDGSMNYPPSNGAVPGTEKVTTLKPGQTLGRYGEVGNKSNFVTKPGASADTLSLPPNTNPNIYQEYVVVKPIPQAVQAKIAPWGGSAGGGTQYELPFPIKQLIRDGYIVPK